MNKKYDGNGGLAASSNCEIILSMYKASETQTAANLAKPTFNFISKVFNVDLNSFNFFFKKKLNLLL